MIKISHALLVFTLLFSSFAAADKGSIRRHIDVDTLYGTIAFTGDIEVRKTPVNISVYIKTIKLRFVPDALFNQVPEAKLRSIRFVATYETEENEVVSLHTDSRPIHVDLDRENRDGEFGDLRFDIHIDDYLGADHVGFAVITAINDQGGAVMWPMRVELRDLYNSR